MPENRNDKLGYFFNIISLIGMILATVATGLIIVLLSVELITGVESPYLGVLVYFIFPAMLITGPAPGAHRRLSVKGSAATERPTPFRPIPILT